MVAGRRSRARARECAPAHPLTLDGLSDHALRVRRSASSDLVLCTFYLVFKEPAVAPQFLTEENLTRLGQQSCHVKLIRGSFAPPSRPRHALARNAARSHVRPYLTQRCRSTARQAVGAKLFASLGVARCEFRSGEPCHPAEARPVSGSPEAGLTPRTRARCGTGASRGYPHPSHRDATTAGRCGTPVRDAAS